VAVGSGPSAASARCNPAFVMRRAYQSTVQRGLSARPRGVHHAFRVTARVSRGQLMPTGNHQKPVSDNNLTVRTAFLERLLLTFVIDGARLTVSIFALSQV